MAIEADRCGGLQQGGRILQGQVHVAIDPTCRHRRRIHQALATTSTRSAAAICFSAPGGAALGADVEVSSQPASLACCSIRFAARKLVVRLPGKRNPIVFIGHLLSYPLNGYGIERCASIQTPSMRTCSSKGLSTLISLKTDRYLAHRQSRRRWPDAGSAPASSPG